MIETLITFCGLLLTALGISIGIIIKMSKNGKAINPNPSLTPENEALVKTGDMAVAYWNLHFQNLHSEIKIGNNKLERVIELLQKLSK